MSHRCGPSRVCDPNARLQCRSFPNLRAQDHVVSALRVLREHPSGHREGGEEETLPGESRCPEGRGEPLRPTRRYRRPRDRPCRRLKPVNLRLRSQNLGYFDAPSRRRCERRSGTRRAWIGACYFTNSRVVWPILTMSPTFNSRGEVSLSSSTKVPFREPRSSIHH